MKRYTFPLLLVIMVLFVLEGCSQGKSDAPEAGLVEFNAAQTMEETIAGSLSEKALTYISGDITAVGSKSEDGLELSLSVRVILPQAIPLVAEEVCSVTADALENEDSFSSCDFQFSYFEESNASGVDGDTLVSWNTSDGNSGMFVDAENGVMGTRTLDELYDYFDGFGK